MSSSPLALATTFHEEGKYKDVVLLLLDAMKKITQANIQATCNVLDKHRSNRKSPRRHKNVPAIFSDALKQVEGHVPAELLAVFEF